jgi:radical SAM protein with 4Fe4S-binding SPASM domain
MRKRLNQGGAPRCHAPWQELVVDSSGDVAPCCYWAAYDNDNPRVGNLNEQTFDEIWNGAPMQALRGAMARGDLEAAGCSKCLAVAQGMALELVSDPSAREEHPPQTAYAQNLALLESEIATGATVLAAKPTVVSLTPSHHCNLRCIHCYQESTRAIGLAREQAYAEFRNLVPSLARLVAGGGEPFALQFWRRFLRDFDPSTNPYLEFAVTTNASCITGETVEQLRKFASLRLNVSMDGGSPAVFERVRVNADFEVVRDGIRRLRSVAREKAPETDSFCGLSMCVMKSTIHDTANLIRFAAAEGLTWSLSPVIGAPVDESLVSFNRPRTEMSGWRTALRNAREAITEWMPAVLETSAGGFTDDDRAHWWHFVDVIEARIPWKLAEQRESAVTLELPAAVVDEAHDLFGPALMAFLYPHPVTHRGRPTYYAPLEGRTARVWVPPGEYSVELATRWHMPRCEHNLAVRVPPVSHAKARVSETRALRRSIRRHLDRSRGGRRTVAAWRQIRSLLAEHLRR